MRAEAAEEARSKLTEEEAAAEACRMKSKRQKDAIKLVQKHHRDKVKAGAEAPSRQGQGCGRTKMLQTAAAASGARGGGGGGSRRPAR